MRRHRHLVAALLTLAVVVLAGLLAYDWTRPCVGGPVKQFVMTVINGGSYTVRCAG